MLTMSAKNITQRVKKNSGIYMGLKHWILLNNLVKFLGGGTIFTDKEIVG